MITVRNDNGNFRSSLNVTRCAFANGSSALYVLNQEHVEIADSAFTSLRKGEDSGFTEGGAFYLDNVDNLHVRGSAFRYNSAYQTGGAWYLSYVSDVLIVDSEFEANVQGNSDLDSVTGGGAMLADWPKAYVARRCTFVNNIAYAGIGGAVKLNLGMYDSATVKFESCVLMRNEEYVSTTQSLSGAAVAIETSNDYEANAQLVVANSTFLGNTGPGGTLGVYQGNVSARILDSTFQDNEGYSDTNSEGFGAGILFYAEYGSFLSKGTLYRNQSGPSGAAINIPNTHYEG